MCLGDGNFECEIWESHRSHADDSYVPECGAVSLGGHFLVFHGMTGQGLHLSGSGSPRAVLEPKMKALRFFEMCGTCSPATWRYTHKTWILSCFGSWWGCQLSMLRFFIAFLCLTGAYDGIVHHSHHPHPSSCLHWGLCSCLIQFVQRLYMKQWY